MVGSHEQAADPAAPKTRTGRYRGLQPRPPWKPGQPGNPGGRPKGYVGPTQALWYVSTLPPDDLRSVRKGRKPKSWPADKPLTAIFALAAGQLLAAIGEEDQFGIPKANATSAQLIFERLDGPIAQVLVVKSEEIARELAPKLGLDPKVLMAKAAELAKGQAK